MAVLVGSALSAPSAFGLWAAAVTNPGDKVASGDLVTAARTGATTSCDLGAAPYSPISSANTATCAGTLLPSGVLTVTGSMSQSTSVSDGGSLPAAGSRLTTTTCGAVSLADTAVPADPMLVRGTTLSYAQPGPLTASTGLGLSGGSSGTGYASDVAGATYAPTTALSEAIWFKTVPGTTTGGTLLGFSSTATTTPTSWDKMLWVDNAGRVVFGVYPGTTVEVTSSVAVNDGAWHLAVGTVSNAGMSLSVDGGPASTNTGTTTTQAYTGYWHVGWDNEGVGWPDPPATPYFAGMLADAAIFPALTSAQVTALARAGTQATWASLLVADGATYGWALGDPGTTAYTGPIPAVTANPCGFVDVTVGVAGTTTTCAAPPSAAPCPTPSGSLTLATLPPSVTLAASPTPSRPITLTFTLARNATAAATSTPGATGLHLTEAMAVVAATSSFSATLLWPAQDVIL